MKIEFNNLYTHFIFSTLHRRPLISEIHRIRIEKFTTGVIKNLNSKLYAIYANPEHMHFLVSRSPDMSEEDLATIVADTTEKFINENKLCEVRFFWQRSAGAFSVSKSDVDRVVKYILNQPEHHKTMTYEEEYQAFVRFYQDTIDRKIKK